MSALFISKIIPPDIIESPALWFIFWQDKLLITRQAHANVPIPQAQDIQALNISSSQIAAQSYLGIWQHQHCFSVALKNSQENFSEEFYWLTLRQAGIEYLNTDLFQLAGRARQILEWDKNYRFCPSCSKVLTLSKTERVKTCSNCVLSFYPRVSPCIIVLIKRGKEILLARSPHFIQNMYSTLAGFIEPGENVEHAVEREVMEEVGITIKNIQYHFSQPWPFPDSLMLGFTAEYAAGEIVIDGVEIEDAGWFTRENLPCLPISLSISRRLIDLFLHS
jgi:NAD+ diphosphatase